MAEIQYAIISIILTAFALAALKVTDYTKFRSLVGSYKAFLLVSILIVVAEMVYLSLHFSLVTYAYETVTSLSVLLIFFAFVYYHKLQNAASGLSLALAGRIQVGDRIEIQKIKGTVVQLGLTKTVIEVDGKGGMRLWIPNKLFDEKVSFLARTQLKKKTI